MKTESIDSVLQQKQRKNLMGTPNTSGQNEIKINVCDQTFNGSNRADQPFLPTINMDLAFLQKEEKEVKTHKHFHKDEEADNFEMMNDAMNDRKEEKSNLKSFQKSSDLKKQQSQHDNNTKKLQMQKYQSMNFNTLDKAQRAVSTFEQISPEPQITYEQYMEQRVIQLEQKNYVLEQNMIFMFNQLRMALPNQFNQQPPYPIMPNSQDYLNQVDEEDTYSSLKPIQHIQHNAGSWPSEIGLIPGCDNISSSGKLLLHSQTSNSNQSHFFGTNSSLGAKNFPLNLQQQLSHFNKGMPCLLERNKSNMSNPSNHLSNFKPYDAQTRPQDPAKSQEFKSIDSLTIGTSSGEKNSIKLPDIIFAYADVMVRDGKDGDNEPIPLNDNESLQPDLMYDQIIRKVRESGVKLTVKKTPLNKSNLLQLLTQRIKVLFILCHGEITVDNNQEISWFCLEDEEDPSMLDRFSEKRLSSLLKDRQIQPEIIVISACHSSRLAQILLNHGAKAIIAIHSAEKVLEKAAQQFNMAFLANLLEGRTAIVSYEMGINNVSGMKEKDVAICCCFHEHKSGCNWEMYEKQNGKPKAHELHTSLCLCYDSTQVSNITVISHKSNCDYYKRFVNNLREVNLNQFELNQDRIGFVKALPIEYKPSDRFQMCCCSSEVAHDESQKILYKGNLERIIFNRSSNFSEGDPRRLVDGDPIEQKPDLSKILLPEDSRPQYHGRKFEKSKIIRFLLDKNARLLHVYGAPRLGKLGAIVKSVRFAAERVNQFFKDGSFIIDVENCNTIANIMQKIAQEVSFYIKDPSQSDIINWFKNEGLNSKNYLLVIENFFLVGDEELVNQFKKFIRDLVQKSNSIKIIVISLDENSLPSMPNWQKLEFLKLTNKQLAEYFRQLLRADRKLKYINKINLEQHKLFQLDHIDISFLPQIVHDLGKNNSLDKIAIQLEKDYAFLQAKQSQEQKKNIDEELASQIFVCQRFLDGAKSKQMVNFVFFLVQAPDGLCKMEIKHLSKLRPTLFTQEDILQLNAAVSYDLQDNEEDPKDDELENQSDSNEETLSSLRKFIDQFMTIQQVNELTEKKFKVQSLQRKGLTCLLKFAEKDKAMESKYGNLNFYESLSIEFFSRYAVKLLDKITKWKRKGEVDHNIVSMHLQQGMWSWEENDEEEQEIVDFNNEQIDMPVERFSCIESNFNNILDAKKLIKYFDLSKGDDFEFERECIINMTLAVPSILIELDRIDDALKLIVQCSKIGIGIGPKLWMHGKLDLMRASLMINRKKDLVNKFDIIMGLLENSREIFLEKKMYEGVAEALYLQALLLNILDRSQVVQISYIHKSKYLLHSQSQKFADNDLPDLMDDEIGQHKKYCASQFQCTCNNCEENQVENVLDLSLDSKGETPKAEQIEICKSSNSLHCMQLAINYFKQDQYQDEDGHFGLGKSELMYIEIQLKEGCRKQNAKDYFEHHQDKMLEMLETANTQFLGLKMHKFQVYYKVLTAKLYYQLDKLEVAKQLIDEAQKIAQDQIRDNYLVSDIQSTKNQILDGIRKNYFNLMTFAMSQPLVTEDERQVVMPIDNIIKSTFDLRSKLTTELDQTKKQFQVNYDILSEDFLKQAAQGGTRVLHLSSDIIDEDNLCVEKENGVAKMLSIKQIESLLKPHTQLTGKLPMDVVCIAIPKSKRIGQVFSNLGVSHVIAFDLQLPLEQVEDTFKQQQYDPYRFNYIYGFLITFYAGIAVSQTVNEAFNNALEQMNDDCKWLDYVLLLNDKQLKLSDLGIIPCLLCDNEARHNKKLYDADQNTNPSMILKNGFIMDTSKQRGQLQGMKKPTTSYIGQQKNMHDVIRWLQDQNDPLALVHVRGRKHVGKTRFIQEVAYHFHRRNKFKFKINYIDLAQIQSRNGFKELLSNLDADCNACTSHYDDSTSSKSEEERTYPSRPIRDSSTCSNSAKKQDLLWVFDNAHALSDNHWSQFEPRIAKKCQNDCCKVIISSANKTFKGRQFHSFNKIGEYKPHSNNEIQKKLLKMRELVLHPLSEMQAVHLLLTACTRDVTKKELGLSAADKMTIHERLRQEKNIERLKNLPYYIIEFAKCLNDYQYDDIQVSVREKDVPRSLQNHQKKNTSQVILIQPKNKQKKMKNEKRHDSNPIKKEKEKRKSEAPILQQVVSKTKSQQSEFKSIKGNETTSSPVEISVNIPLDQSQHSFEVPVEEKHKALAQNKEEGNQLRIQHHFSQLREETIFEISSSEMESNDNRSRTISFNEESIAFRGQKNDLLSPPDNYMNRNQKMKQSRDEEYKGCLMQGEMRNRNFSDNFVNDFNADTGQEGSMTSSQQVPESVTSLEAEFLINSNAKILKQVSNMESDSILVPKKPKLVKQPVLFRNRPSQDFKMQQQDEKSSDDYEQPFIMNLINNSEVPVRENNLNQQLRMMSLSSEGSFPSLSLPQNAKKAQSHMELQHLQSLNLANKISDPQKTDSFGRYKTEDLSQLIDETEQLQHQEKKKQKKNTSDKKAPTSKINNEEAHKPPKVKSGKHINKFAKKTKNAFREKLAQKRSQAEPQDQDHASEQDSVESSSSEEKQLKKTNKQPKKYSKHTEEQKYLQKKQSE